MVQPHYMLAKPPGPSRPMVFLNQSVVPALIDASAAAEGAAERLAVFARRSPLVALVAAIGAGAVLSALVRRGRTH